MVAQSMSLYLVVFGAKIHSTGWMVSTQESLSHHNDDCLKQGCLTLMLRVQMSTELLVLAVRPFEITFSGCIRW